MGNIIADFEINEVEESEIQQVQSELTAIKGTDVDKESQNPGSSVDKYLDISDNRDCTESNLSSPTEYHSARNSEHFPFTDSDASDIESEDNVLSHEINEMSDGQPRNQLSTESETSGDCHENCLMCQHDMYDLLNPDDLSNTGSEVSDFDSDFDFDLTAGDNATFRNTKTSGSSDSDPTIENVSSQSVSESDMTPNKPDSSNVLCTEDKPAGKFIKGGNPSSEDTSGSNCIFSEKAARGDECCNRNTVVADQSQGNTRSTNQVMHAVISSGTGSDADDSSFNSQPQSMGVGDGCEGMMPCNSMTDGDSRGDDGEMEEKKRSPSHQKDEMLTVETPGIQSTLNKDNFDESQPNCHIMEVNCDVHSGNALLAERPVSAVFTELGQDRNVDQDRVVSTQSDQEREREGLMGPIESPPTTENGHLSNALVDKENMDEYPSIIRDIIKNHHRFVEILSKYEQICSVKLDLVSVLEKHQPVKEDMQGSDTEGMSTKNSDRGGATQGPGPGGGQRPLSPRSPGFHKHRNLDAPKTVMDVDYKLLNSGIAVLPGSRDSEERPVVFIFTNSSLWQNQQVPSTELARLLMYYRSIPRDEVRLHGFTVVAVIQGATSSIINTLLESLYLFEGNCPGGIAVLHFLADTYTQPLLQMSPVFDSQTPFKLDVLLAPELLQEFIPLNQLPLDLDGHYMYNHEEWIRFHVELDPFISKIRGVAKYLMVTMQELSEPHIMPVTAQEARQLIEHHEQSMKAAFNDSRLISLQNEGESIINCLRRLDAHMGHSEDYRDLMESVNKLYDNLNSTMVKLVHIADSRLSKLEHCQQLREFEEECTKIIAWTERTGEEYLQRHTQLGDNLKSIRVQQKEFEKFYFSAMTHIEKGNDLLDEASMLAQSGNFEEATGYKELARTLKKHLQSFTSKLEDTREQIERTAKCYQLLDKTYEWALDAMKYVASMKMEHCETLNGLDKLLRSLDLYLRDHPVMKPETFTCMFDLAEKLHSDKLLEQCRVAKERCDETQKLLMLRQCTLKRAREKLEVEQQETSPPDSMKSLSREQSPASSVVSSRRFPSPQESVWEPQSSSTPLRVVRPHPELRKSMSDRFLRSQLPREDFYTQDMSDRIVTALPKSLIESRHGSSREDLTDTGSDMASASPSHDFKPQPLHSVSPINSTSSLPYHRPQKKVLKRVPTVPSPGNIIMEEEDQSMDRNHQVWSKSQDPRPISLITASSDSLSSLPEEETENQAPGEDNPPPLPPLPREWTPVPVNTHLTSMPAVSELKLSNAEKSKRTLTHIMREMVQTERDYVLSLQYVIENYIPELQRPDVPQALRGKGSIIFGNIEKIYQFHRQYFLREVERCEKNPFQISHYFLMHESQFYLYALYNKNKPKSDMLMAEYGKVFFKDKQAKLGDKMDLGSYLLKPVQRMGKYALLLKQIMKECPPTDQEYQDLRAAEQMVKFQLRHGNDLLAMDSLRDCDVNLQEQGRLLRQDEFIVWQGRRKSLRHVFLFEDLILFSKTRRGRSGGPDSYFYKFSLKMAEVGLTESYGDTGYKFEIWFRKRSKGESYILQAQSSDIRHHWVKEISRVLWNQAITNREKHMSEMATMGIGNKPCLEIKPSANQINDRFINVASGNFQSRTRNSIAVSSFDHMYQNNKRPHSIISISSTSSSSSSHSGAFHPHHLPPDTSRTTNYLSNESGIGTDISSGEDHGIRYDQSERGIAFTRQPAINESNLFSDTISTDV